MANCFPVSSHPHLPSSFACPSYSSSSSSSSFAFSNSLPSFSLGTDGVRDFASRISPNNNNNINYPETRPESRWSCLAYSSIQSTSDNLAARGEGGRGGGGGGTVSWGKNSSSSSSPAVSNRAKLCGVCGDKALGYNFDAITCESCKAFFRRNAPKGLDHFKCCYDGQCVMTLCNRRVCKRCRLSKCFLIGMRREYILTEEERRTKRQKIDGNRSLVKVKKPEKEAVKSHSSSNSTVTFPSQSHVPSDAAPLTDEDAAAIQDLVTAYRESLRVNVDHDPPRQHANLSDLVNIAELSVRRVIAMAKRLQSFRSVSYQDQIHLLKGGSIELLILRSVLTFDKDKQHFLDPLDEEETKALRIDQLENAETGTGLFEQHMKFVRSLTLDLNADETTMILLLVIALFSPDRDNLTDRSLIATQQERHCTLLKRYLESINPSSVARVLFPKMLLKLTDVRNLNEEHSLVLLKVNPDGIQPLMQEFLDLRCQS